MTGRIGYRYNSIDDIEKDLAFFNDAIPVNIVGVSKSFNEACLFLLHSGLNTSEVTHHPLVKQYIQAMLLMTK